MIPQTRLLPIIWTRKSASPSSMGAPTSVYVRRMTDDTDQHRRQLGIASRNQGQHACRTVPRRGPWYGTAYLDKQHRRTGHDSSSSIRTSRQPYGDNYHLRRNLATGGCGAMTTLRCLRRMPNRAILGWSDEHSARPYDKYIESTSFATSPRRNGGHGTQTCSTKRDEPDPNSGDVLRSSW